MCSIIYVYIYNYAISDIVQYSSANIKTPRVLGIRPARNIAKVFTSVDMATTSNAAERWGVAVGAGVRWRQEGSQKIAF